MSKFTEFFKAKATQIAITAVSASLVVGASAGVAIHNNNKKLEAALYELSSTSTTESVTESSSETTTESTTDNTTESTTKITTTTATKPAGDRTIQYLAEYKKITREYEKKRDELLPLTLTQVKLEYYGSNTEEALSVSEYNSLADEHNIEAEKYQKQLDELNEQYQEDIKKLKKEYGITD